MPKQIPFPTKLKQELPEETKQRNAEIDPSKLVAETPVQTPPVQKAPTISELLNKKPEQAPLIEETPDPSPSKEEKPSDVIEENCVVVNGVKIELKPTKLKYFRNKAASAYGLIRAVPLPELLTYGKGTLDENRDADQLLYDFLVAAFDDSTLVRDNYDEMTADDVEKVVKIFGRLNHIDEKEEQARKNKEAQAQKR